MIQMIRMIHEKILIFGPVLWIALVLSAWAEETASEQEVYQLEEIVVTATRMETPVQEVAANIVVLTRKDMEEIPASNAAELLQYLPGVYVEFNGGLGSPSTAVIQGSKVQHVAVYQDGVPLNQLANPLTDLSYLPVDTIERIEVYKGAASSSWGSSLGGVINIITREPDPKRIFTANIHVSYGDFKTSKSRASFSGTANRFGYLLSLTHDESDGFMANASYKQDAVYAKINYDLNEKSRMGFAYSYDEGRIEEPLPKYPFWDDNYRKRTYQQLFFEMFPTDDFILFVEGHHHRFYNRIEDVHPDRRDVFNDYNDRIYGFSTRMRWITSAANTLNIGFDEDWGKYDYFRYDKAYETRNAALYVNDTYTVGALSINAGLRYDDNADFGNQISPSIGAVYRMSGEKALIRSQIARGFSAPPAAWVHAPPFNNPMLDPEISMNYQLGGSVTPFPFLILELNLFQSDIKDLILPNLDILKYENIGKVTRRGVEGSLRAAFDIGLSLTFSGSYIDVKDDITGEVIKDIPRTIYNVAATYSHWWMTHSILGKCIDHNSSYSETRDQIFVFDYLLKVDLPLHEHYGRFNLYAAVYNVTNASYIYNGNWPKPDRWFEGGIRFAF